MSKNRDQISILMADDDEDDRILVKAALEESKINNHVDFVEDGEELIDFLKRQGQFVNLKGTPLPGLILLDLNMPRKDGREALEEIRADDVLSHIPVIILTTSQADEDVAKTYKLGANSFISKPSSFDELVAITDALKQYWLGLVRLPDANIAIMNNKTKQEDKTS